MMLDRSELKLLVERALAGERAAVEAVVGEIQDEVYALALRMLGERPAAEDASQEIVLQALTHLAQWRGEASLRHWVRRIAVRHLLRARRTRMEEMFSFDALSEALEAGEANPPLPAAAEAELRVLESELRLICTQGMLLSLDRDQRVAFLLTKVFELTSEQGADIVGVEPATFRKRVQRARERLGEWMVHNCGLVSAQSRCNCRRQIPVGISIGAMRPEALQLTNHPVRERRRLAIVYDEVDEIERAAAVVCSHPDYAAPESLAAAVRDILDSGRWRLFDA